MKVIGIHGIAHEYSGANLTRSQWLPALQSGLERVGVAPIDHKDFAMVFYGHLFRPSGTRDAGIPPFGARDVKEGWETELLMAWWYEAAALAERSRIANNSSGEDPSITGPNFQGRGRMPMAVQTALRELSKSRFFKRLGSEKALIFSLKQVRQYLYDLKIKEAILELVSKEVLPDTRVIIGHSLGSIVAYEALCAHPEWTVNTLVTLGSPLGIRNLIFDSLTPSPTNGVGTWPHVKHWFNVADEGDIVALEKNLAPLFGCVIDELVYNGWKSHLVENYLTAQETGRAIATGIY